MFLMKNEMIKPIENYLQNLKSKSHLEKPPGFQQIQNNTYAPILFSTSPATTPKCWANYITINSLHKMSTQGGKL
jgi:hypothetical protein